VHILCRWGVHRWEKRRARLNAHRIVARCRSCALVRVRHSRTALPDPLPALPDGAQMKSASDRPAADTPSSLITESMTSELPAPL